MDSRITIAVAASLLAGCASQPLLPPIRAGEPVSVVAVASPGNNRGERIVLTLKATITLARGTGDPESKTFSYLGPESDARLWLDDRDGFVADSFRHAYRHIALDIVSELGRSNGAAPRS